MLVPGSYLYVGRNEMSPSLNPSKARPGEETAIQPSVSDRDRCELLQSGRTTIENNTKLCVSTADIILAQVGLNQPKLPTLNRITILGD